MTINNQWTTQEIKEEIKKIPRDKRKLIHKIKTPWDTANAVLGGKFINNTIIPQETRKISNIHPNLTPKAIRERRTNKTQS